MKQIPVSQQQKPATPLLPICSSEFSTWLEQQSSELKTWIAASGFSAKKYEICLVSATDGGLDKVLCGINNVDDPHALGQLPQSLPLGCYQIAVKELNISAAQEARLALGWALGGYQFSRYKKPKRAPAELIVNKDCAADKLLHTANAIYRVRDLVNTPAADMMPENLAEVFESLAGTHKARFKQYVGDELLTHNFPTIHAVGRASIHPPRLLELRWGKSTDPKVTLVGKGVCFDSGGLDLKGAAGMRLMKKDMGGSAHAIALAELIMSEQLPIQLRLLVPAAENAVSSNSYRPGDVITTRKGITVEIDNTDAEGRLVLCDALAAASEEQPELIIDFATLTGAAKVALGTDLPAMFSNQEQLSTDLRAASTAAADPVWPMPLFDAYREFLDSNTADMTNSAGVPYAGAITAALFLKAFVAEDIAWVHFDIMAWNLSNRPGRPQGGEAMGLRAVYSYLEQRYQ